MITLLEFVLTLFVLCGVAFFRPARVIWTPLVAVLLVFAWGYTQLPWWILGPISLLYVAVALVINIPALRLPFLSKPLLRYFQGALPTMSDTERTALEAGDVWWDGELFQGRPDWQQLLSFRKPTLSQEEQSFLDNQVETLCSMIDDWKNIQEEADLSPEVWAYIKKERFWGMVIPKEYGGLGFSALAHSTVITKIGSRSGSAAVTVMVPNSLGPAELILEYGTDEQKNHYLPRLARGEDIPCFALTGPEAGSDAGSIPDTGIVCKGKHEGKEVIGIRLNWDKRYITLAPVATVLGIAFKLFDPNHLLGDKKDIGITLGLIPSKTPGVSSGERHCPLNIAFLNGPTRGKDVFIPLDWIIGGVDMAGQGWRMLMESLSVGRSISIPALSTAMAKMSYLTTGAYSKVRKQFKVSIGEFEGIQESLARIGGNTYLLEACRLMTADAVGQGVRPSLVSAIAKYQMTELCRQAVLDAMDVHGGKAIQLGPKNYIGHAYMTLPISITVEGANIMTRNLLIFGQGALRCHPYIREEMEAAANENFDEAVTGFDQTLVAHIGYAVSNFARTFIYGLSGARFVRAPVTGVHARYYRQLTRMSQALAFVSDVAMLLLGGELKRKERLSARLGDVLSNLYLSSAVLKYYQDQGEPKEDLAYVHWCLQTCLSNIQVAFDEFFVNFVNPTFGRFLRFFVFPFGRTYSIPKDSCSQQVAQAMLIPSAFRDRLTQYCYVGEGKEEPVRQLEDAFVMMSELADADKKLQQALRAGTVARDGDFNTQLEQALKANILTKEEVAKFKEFEILRLAVINVDEFPFDALAKKTAVKLKKTA